MTTWPTDVVVYRRAMREIVHVEESTKPIDTQLSIQV
jgi:hypothetical protein